MRDTLVFHDIPEDIISRYKKCGVFIDTRHAFFHHISTENEISDNSYIKPIKRDLVCNHESDQILSIFSAYLLPKRLPIIGGKRVFNKEGAIDSLKERISEYSEAKDDLSFYDYIKMELLKFFEEAYKSNKTRFLLDGEKTDGLYVDLRDTLKLLNFKPREYMLNGEYNWIINSRDLYNLMKMVLIQACKIDSVEIAPIQYGVHGKTKIQKTITTACDNPFERFFEYYLKEYRIDVLPQLKLIDGEYSFFEPISRYTNREQEYRNIIKNSTGVDPEQNVYRPITHEKPTELIK